MRNPTLVHGFPPGPASQALAKIPVLVPVDLLDVFAVGTLMTALCLNPFGRLARPLHQDARQGKKRWRHLGEGYSLKSFLQIREKACHRRVSLDLRKAVDHGADGSNQKPPSEQRRRTLSRKTEACRG